MWGYDNHYWHMPNMPLMWNEYGVWMMGAKPYNYPAERIFRNTRVNPLTGCWEWKLQCNKKGYGRVWLGRKGWLAHRLSYTCFVGPIPHGKLVLHTCDTPGCTNPAHLFIGTAKDNYQDMRNKGRAIVLCGEQCGNSRLTREHVKEIRYAHSTGTYSQRQLAKAYRVGRSTIRDIIKGVTWKEEADDQAGTVR